jgi:hypothetical protein
VRRTTGGHAMRAVVLGILGGLLVIFGLCMYLAMRPPM